MIAAARIGPGQAITLDLLTLDAWAQTARANAWLAYSLADRLDTQSPVAALVRGLVKGGDFSISEARDEAGNLQHRITRTKPSAIERHWQTYEAQRLPQPPSGRDPDVVSPAMMAHWAMRRDEPAEWIRFAIQETTQRLIAPDASAAEKEASRIEAATLLTVLADLLTPGGDGDLFAKIRPRPHAAGAGRHARAKMPLVRAKARAATLAAELKAGGLNLQRAVPKVLDASKEWAAHETANGRLAYAISEADLDAERTWRARMESLSVEKSDQVRCAARLVKGLCAGRMLRSDAERHAAMASGMELGELRKWLRHKDFKA